MDSYVAGTCSSAEVVAFEYHLSICDVCRTMCAVVIEILAPDGSDELEVAVLLPVGLEASRRARHMTLAGVEPAVELELFDRGAIGLTPG